MARKNKKSKKALLSRLYYHKKKLNQIIKQHKKYSKRSNNKFEFEGKRRTEKTISDILLDRGKEINNVISEIENSIKDYNSREEVKKFKKSDVKKIKGDLLKEVGNVWHRKDFDQHLNLPRIKKINGFIKTRDWDKIKSEADKMFLRMNSKDIACILEHKDGTAEIFLIKESKVVSKSKAKVRCKIKNCNNQQYRNGLCKKHQK